MATNKFFHDLGFASDPDVGSESSARGAGQTQSVLLLNNSRETFTSDRSGAIATCLWELCRAGVRAGSAPHVVSRRTDGAAYDWHLTTWIPAARERRAFRTMTGRVRRRVTGWARLDQEEYAGQVVPVIRRLRPAVVVVNNDPEIAAQLRRVFPSVRIVHWFHNLETVGDRFRKRLVLDPEIDLVGVSDYVSRAVETVYGLATFRVRTARNGVNTQWIRPRDAHSTPPVIGFVGRMAVEKGVDVLIDACLLLADRGVQFGLQIVGDTNWGFRDNGAYGAGVARRVAELRATGVEVRQIGHMPRARIPDLLVETDIHVVPSRWDEPIGLTVLEGMAAGLAVVGTASGGIPEVIWKAGRLVPRDNAHALAEVLQELIGDAGQRVALGALAREEALKLSWDATWAALIESTTGSDHGRVP